MNHQKRIEQLFKDYEVAGLIEGDSEKIMSYLADNIVGIGMGDQGFITSHEQIRKIVTTTKKTDNSITYELDFNNMQIQFLSDTAVAAFATVLIKQNQNGKITNSGFMQSLNFVYQNGDWRICSLHASPLELTRESIEAYPMTFANNMLTQMRSEVQNEAFTLMSSSLSGGILCTYIMGRGFPLYFANESLVSLLGYELDEFIKLYKSNPAIIIHPDDTVFVYEQMAINTAKGADFELRYRLIKKDGSTVWVIEHARQTIDDEGHPILIGVFTDVTEMIELQQKLEKQAALLEEQAEELTLQQESLVAQAEALTISEGRFRIALERTSNVIFDYDLASGTILHSSALKSNPDFTVNISNAKENLIIGGIVMDEYLGALDETFRKIQQGEEHSSCIVKVKLLNGQQRWNNITMTGILNSDGKAVRAVGLIEDITKQKEAEIAYAREEQFRRAILADSMASYVVNFTNNVFESCQIFDQRCITTEPNEPYDSFIDSASKPLLSQADRLVFLDMFSTNSVLRAFEDGVTELKLEYQFHELDGTKTWMQTILRLVIDFTTNEKKGFLYVTDIDEQKQSELALTFKSERDPLTNLYNKTVIESRINKKLNASEGWLVGVFMMLDVDYFKNINDTYGHPFGDHILSSVAGVLTHCFRDSDLLGRIGGDEFCVFFCGVATRARTEEVAQQICDDIRNILLVQDDKPGTSCSIGITICNNQTSSFEQLYREADHALYEAKKKGRNCYSFFE